MFAAPDRTSPPFTVLDWIGALVTGSAIAGLILFPVSSFRTMFAELASHQDLPLLTRLVLLPGFTLGLALPAAATLAFGLRTRRRMWIVLAFGLSCVGTALCLVAMYLPIFTLADKIRD